MTSQQKQIVEMMLSSCVAMDLVGPLDVSNTLSEIILNLFSEFPSGCVAYNGPYSVACLNEIWTSAGCLSEGTEFPAKLSSSIVNGLTGVGLRFVDLKCYLYITLH